MFVVDNLVRNMPHPDESRPKERMCVESDAPYQNLNVIKRLSKAKFPVYLASSKINGQHYAMKLFGYQKDKPHPYYVNEARFASLKHPNVIQIIYCEDKKDTLYKQELKSTSYILMEYAPHGDFFDLITKSKSSFDDRLVRTYFRQLIEGVEYLHSQGVAHLDLKPENLLVGKDYSLKIADFDLSHISGDKKVISKGTKYYRGPELFKCKGANPELKAPFATDIYSVAVILFVMKSGGIYPHCESDPLGGIYLADLLSCDTMEFWKKHCELQEREASYYEASFKDLFNGMTKCDPEERITIKEIKESEWYNGPVYSARELEKKVKEMLRC